MSMSFTPGRDLILGFRIPAAASVFTTFATGHFIKPGQFTQPVKAITASTRPTTFVGGYSEVFAAAPVGTGNRSALSCLSNRI